jgi:hypothetical protein
VISTKESRAKTIHHRDAFNNKWAWLYNYVPAIRLYQEFWVAVVHSVLSEDTCLKRYIAIFKSMRLFVIN